MTTSKLTPRARILESNDRQAHENRRLFDDLGLTAVNVMASPGAGKTSLIVSMLRSLDGLRVGVIEGDVASSLDTEKIRALNFPAVQINTGGGCHLTSAMIAQATRELGVRGPGLLFIENIGNLICPAMFDLGEHLRLVVASVPEGDDKPVKYPGAFASADAVALNKTDLLGLVDFAMDRFEAGVRAVNPKAPIFAISCRKGENTAAVRDWLLSRRG